VIFAMPLDAVRAQPETLSNRVVTKAMRQGDVDGMAVRRLADLAIAAARSALGYNGSHFVSLSGGAND
jgi:hypothetical protein